MYDDCNTKVGFIFPRGNKVIRSFVTQPKRLLSTNNRMKKYLLYLCLITISLAGCSKHHTDPQPQQIQPSNTDTVGGKYLPYLKIDTVYDYYSATQFYLDVTHETLTGDTLYPGLLTVRDWPAYRRSANRLADFVANLPVSHVLGAHIEMKKTPKEMYPLGSKFQPDEHPLPLTKKHVEAWRQACEALGGTPRRDVHDEFIIEPV